MQWHWCAMHTLRGRLAVCGQPMTTETVVREPALSLPKGRTTYGAMGRGLALTRLRTLVTRISPVRSPRQVRVM